ncbi:MAG: sulfatase-like hydrolase/transferase [Opitutales bacterium]|jgi:arylsulfatase A-like enzyme|nr:sulfatase-like hydrolase/transferase [Opitutales bacterium]MBT5813671.1 sulfatase-like hydrolase/transferase [Opitutales bacterium]MBT6769656.1 sulfatase-like hydrolase/transferase [Opitutales bacterium]MBT7866730.1 sulfatase-like hydrolase/transferase [Opitutales bacterium]
MTINLIRKSILILGLLAITQVAAAAKQPNILLIVADDQGYVDFGFRGLRDDIKTPVLDRIASEGTTLTNAYATSAICSPSRMGLTSGLHQARFGAFHYGGGRGMNEVEVTKTLPARLQQAGYRTAHIGKHHFVGNRGSKPSQHDFPLGLGYDRFFGSIGGRIHYLYHSESKRAEHSQRMAMETMWDNDRALKDWEGFTTDDWTNEAIDFIAEPSDKPFFVQMAYNAVHNFAWQLPPEELEKRGLPVLEDLKHPEGLSKAEATKIYNEWYDGVHRHTLPEGRGWYLAQLELMDAAIGRILDHLKRTSMEDNTIVIYTVDNGGCTSDWAENGPLEGSKYHLFEGGTRTMTLVRYPNHVSAGKTNNDLIFSHLDIAPTVLEWCGIPYENDAFDGVTQVDALSGKRTKSNSDRILHWDLGFQWSVRSGNWKLMVTEDEAKAANLAKKEALYVAQGVHLYNLVEDPGETKNVAAHYPEIVQQLRRLHDGWRTEVDSTN